MATPKFGKYDILREIGEGNYSKVYLIEWENNKKERKRGALKLLKDTTAFKDILEETGNWAKVSSNENVLTFYNAGEHEGDIYFISEYVEEGSLEKLIKSSEIHNLTLKEKITFVLGILHGLNHLHKNDIFHRDLKPANILIKNGIPLLADFGFARNLDFAETYKLRGTPIYSSPEWIDSYLNHDYGNPTKFERSVFDDLWAIACVSQEIFTGKLAFDSLAQIKDVNPNPLPEDTPSEIVEILNKSFQKERKYRFQSVDEIIDKYETYLQNTYPIEIPENDEIASQNIEKLTYDFEEKKEILYPSPRLYNWKMILGIITLLVSLTAVFGYYLTLKSAQDYVNLANESLKNGLKDEAIVHFSSAISLDGKKADYFFDRGNVYFYQQNWDDAIKDYLKTIELTPNSEAATYNVGLCYANKNEFDNAIRYLNDSIIINPNKSEAFDALGDSFLMKDEMETAFKNYDKAIELDSSKSSVFDDCGKTYFNKKEYGNAIKCWDKFIRLSPEVADGYFNLGLAYYFKGSKNESSIWFAKAIEKNDKYALAYKWTGDVYYETGFYDKAIQNFESAVKNNPENKEDTAECYYRIGSSYNLTKKYKDAEKNLQNAISLKNNYPLAYLELGYVYENTKQLVKAEESYNKTLEYQPENAEAHYNLGTIIDNKNCKKAIEHYTLAISSKKDFANSYYQRSLCYEKLGQKQKAKEDMVTYDNLP